MNDADTIARALGGKPILDGWLCRCPVPSHGQGHGDRNPSLLIKDGDRALLLKCFAGCEPREVLDELRCRGLIDRAETSSDRRRSNLSFAPARRSDPPHEPDPAAVAMWRKGVPIAGTKAGSYLRARGLVLEPPPSLRALPIVELVAGSVWLPAMVAGVQAPDRRVIAAQLTFIDPRGDRKAQVAVPRKTIGALGFGAVRLGPVGDELGLAEGVEDALAAIQLTGMATWACLGAGRMHRVQIPDAVKVVHIFADDDEAGRAAAERTAARHKAEGRRVVIRLAPAGVKDWADFAATKPEAIPA